MPNVRGVPSKFQFFMFSITSLKLEEYHSHLSLIPKSTLEFKVEYYENLTRASRSNTGTVHQHFESNHRVVSIYKSVSEDRVRDYVEFRIL